MTTADAFQRGFHKSPPVPQIQQRTQVPTFRSKVNFEEDYLSNNLEFVFTETVSPGDKHGWFDALDFWYWDGIKNGGDAAEMRLEFPLYDVAKSFDTPHISVDLQGGTPVPHQILVSVNGIRIKVAEWQQQTHSLLSAPYALGIYSKTVSKANRTSCPLPALTITLMRTRLDIHIMST